VRGGTTQAPQTQATDTEERKNRQEEIMRRKDYSRMRRLSTSLPCGQTFSGDVSN